MNMTSDDNFTLPSDLKNPFLRTSATLSPSPPLTFSTVIEDDHSRINAVAISIGRSFQRSLRVPSSKYPPLSSKQLKERREEQLKLLRELTWRLIRHDVSEDLIMRPAFKRWLGREGKERGEEDRRDHDHARDQLVILYEDFEAFPLDVSSESGSASDSTSVAKKEKGRLEFTALTKRFKDLMTELAEHMKIESGNQIPRLEGMLSREESEGLARRYIATYVLGPGLVVKGEKVWKGGVGEYVREKREKFHGLWAEMEQGQTGKGERGRGNGGKL